MKMQIVRSVVFEEEDQSTIKRIVEDCHMARNFIFDEELKQISWLQSGNTLTEKQLATVLETVEKALARVRGQEPHPLFLDETKQHVANLWKARSEIANWLMELRRT